MSNKGKREVKAKISPPNLTISNVFSTIPGLPKHHETLPKGKSKARE